MIIIKYIFDCIIGCFDALVGNNFNGGIKEEIIGLVSILLIILLFFAALLFLDKNSNMSYKIRILSAIAITFVALVFISLIIIIAEKIFLH